MASTLPAEGGAPLLERLAGAIAWRVFVSTVYTTGLTLLIPFVILRVLPPDLGVVPPGAPPLLLWVAVGMMFASFVVRLWVTHSVSGSLKTLGCLTFIPGFVGILVTVFGRETLLRHLARAVPRFDQIRAAVELYLDRVVPQVLYLTVGFFVFGLLLLLVGDWLAPHRPAAPR